MADIVHVVLFKFKESASAEKVQSHCDAFVALKDGCVRASSKEPYITSLKAGTDHSPEGAQGGLTHGFVVGFSSLEDRDYYVTNDPAHKAFVAGLKGDVDKIVVLDFTDGVFN